MTRHLQHLTCNLAGNNVAGHGTSCPLACTVVDGVVPALILGAEATVHDAVARPCRRSIRLTVFVQRRLKKPALAVVLHRADVLRQAGIIKVNPDFLHLLPRFPPAAGQKSNFARPRYSRCRRCCWLENPQKASDPAAAFWE